MAENDYISPYSGAQVDSVVDGVLSGLYTYYKFDSVSDMLDGKTSSGADVDMSSIVGSSVKWLGYYTELDGGGNFGVVKSGSHTEDGGSVFSIDSSTYVEAVFEDQIVNSSKFGVVATNPPEDSAELQNCFNYANISGKAGVSYGTKIWLTDAEWNPIEDAVYGRSTPYTSLLSFGGHYNEMGAAGVNYKWGMNGWLTNGSTAPVTVSSNVSQGWKVRSVDATSRQVGAGGDAHSLEIISGQYAASCSATITNGSNELVVESVTFDGSRFCVGDVVSGDGIDIGSLIVSVTDNLTGNTATGYEITSATSIDGGSGYAVGDTIYATGGDYTRVATLTVKSVSGTEAGALLVTDGGDYNTEPLDGITTTTDGAGTGLTLNINTSLGGYGEPSSITIDNAATSSGSVSIDTRCEANQNIGILVTGGGNGCLDESGNENGRGIQFQSYGEAAFKYGINMGGSAVRSDGTAMRFTFNESYRNYSVESSSFSDSLFYISGVDCGDSVFQTANTDANYGIRFDSNSNFLFSAIYLQGQDIGTDSSIGMRIATNQLSKLGFWGRTPQVRPDAVETPSGGSVVDSECRASLNDLISKLENIGLLSIG